MDNQIGFTMYMVHGGTSFGKSAGANFDAWYAPDLTSYDYGAPISEQGIPTSWYYKY